jgi:two-component system NtrC family sensor kinase
MKCRERVRRSVIRCSHPNLCTSGFTLFKELPVPGKAVGFTAVELPWLCPETDSLITLAESPANLGPLCSRDVGLTVFLYRFAKAAAEPDIFGFAPGAFHSPVLPEMAAAFLGSSRSGVIPRDNLAIQLIQSVVDRAVTLAKALAQSTRLAPQTAVAHVTQLVPLGWYAVASVDGLSATDVLLDPDYVRDLERIQNDVWGIEHQSITRRLARRWRLPEWIGTTISSLTLPVNVAQRLVTHPGLFAIVQLAVMIAQEQTRDLGLTRGADRQQLTELLQLDDTMLEQLCQPPSQQNVSKSLPPQSNFDRDPHSVPLLISLLRTAGQSRRRNGNTLVHELECHIDHLHKTIHELGVKLVDQLRDAKLTGLAEFAAGAGHEINNPLAIISSNAQQLLRSEERPERQESLHAIVRQSNRIAGLLRELMEFARPPRPVPQYFTIDELCRAVEKEMAPLAMERKVHLKFDPCDQDIWIHADCKQVTRSLIAVVRNAIEATPSEGLVRVWVSLSEAGDPTITVEDTGPGLPPDVALHAFDPFFSGRRAGRGRGLGLSTAWRLLQQNGGSIRHIPTATDPTRFVIKLTKAEVEQYNGRQSA